MSFVKQINNTNAPTALERLRMEAEIGLHAPGTLEMAGVNTDRVDAINMAEERLFTAAVASLVPGIDADMQGARQSLDGAIRAALCGYNDGKLDSLTVLKRISNAFAAHGLSNSQLGVS